MAVALKNIITVLKAPRPQSFKAHVAKEFYLG